MITSKKRGETLTLAFAHTLLTVLAVIWLLPIAWLIIRSFQGEKGAWIPTILPQEYTFQNYVRLFTERELFDYPLWFMNTFVVAVFSCILSTLLVLMISYTFSRLRFKTRTKFMNIGLILGMFPGFMTMIAVYHILKAFGLYQSHISLVIVYSTNASLGYFIAKGFFDTIPKAIDEAAIIDGASRNRIFWTMTIPLSKPIIIYTASVYLS